ncbi:tyrosine-type recombinase/integrase [Haloprofundus halobius]|uniref:tyrosine-type recombinase/integrase n=1 Tax=Haloprofundus halobius TaxID=2876194 RepID=UPI001CCB778C|nr:site-specific integrase [Haloprofundus halobius]
MSDELIPLTPAEGVERFLAHRKPSVAKSTFHNNKTVLEHFLAWCREDEVDNLNDINGRLMADFVTWRREQVEPITLQKNLSAVREALGYWADIDAVQEGLRERVHAPEVPDGSEARDIKVSPEQAREIVSYLDRFQYASRDHVIIGMLWRTCMRLGALRSIDVDDLRPEKHAVYLRHRPQSETPLKNGQKSERWVWLGPTLSQIVEDYVEHHREDVKDDHGRKPLLSSRFGRLSETAIRNCCYRMTQPCVLEECPHGREPRTCEAVGEQSLPSKCPSSRSPHAFRRGAITDHLNRGVPPEVVSERADVGLDVLYKHYDARRPDQKMDVRVEEFLKSKFDDKSRQ